MTDNKGGWDEDRVYTVIQNTTKNSKVVLSNLRGMEIGPGQTVDLRTMFRKAEVMDAVHEIGSLIRTGHLRDLGDGAEKGPIPVAGGAPTPEELKARMRGSMLREISDSTSLGFLEDQLKNPDPEVAKAAKIRAEMLLGMRDDSGQIIPGHEEENAEPTKLIRGDDAASTAPGAGVVHRAV